MCTALRQFSYTVLSIVFILRTRFNYNRTGCGMWSHTLQGVNFRSTQLKHETWFTNLLADDQAARTQNEYEPSTPLSCASISIFRLACLTWSVESRTTLDTTHVTWRRHVGSTPSGGATPPGGPTPPGGATMDLGRRFLGFTFLPAPSPSLSPSLGAFPELDRRG